ncbi:MAG: LysM peptidoglycan-binding domain-containing protein, partial [Firmicutes bacterium]|nr:LysM peptidoglycan-binding domain-containing protein [Bacillota bacterium]
SYEIKKGDTLSSIAQKYASGVNMSRGDYTVLFVDLRSCRHRSSTFQCYKVG